MTPRPETAPAAGIATTFALRAQAVATPAAEAIRPANQATFKLTTTDEKWGQIRPSRWGQRKSSFSLVALGRINQQARIIGLVIAHTHSLARAEIL